MDAARGAWIATPGSRCVRRLRLTGSRVPFTLWVHLVRGGEPYRYKCFSAKLFLEFLAAPSKGRFYGAFVRGKLPRVGGEDDEGGAY